MFPGARNMSWRVESCRVSASWKAHSENFRGAYSGCRNHPIIEIDRVSHQKTPLYEALYLGMPWTELDYMCAVNTSAPH